MEKDCVKILYADRRILVCVKPFGVLSTDEPGGLPEIVRGLLAEADASVRTVHRLDRVAGGVTVLARSREAARRLGGSVQDRAFGKEYLAVVEGTPPERGTMRDLLARDRQTRRTFVTDTPGKDVREAALDYRTLGSAQGYSLVHIRLHTGRTHQIRAQFSSRRFPLAGDRKYGGQPIRDNEIALWSYALSFPHPQTEQTVRFSCPPPDTFPWDLFEVDRIVTTA
ncbi:MAG: RNA pseudouridine synthase [Clostridia bacterium]|nr:RNA pseudouridine synthase [Clostridia bacterium]